MKKLEKEQARWRLCEGQIKTVPFAYRRDMRLLAGARRGRIQALRAWGYWRCTGQCDISHILSVEIPQLILPLQTQGCFLKDLPQQMPQQGTMVWDPPQVMSLYFSLPSCSQPCSPRMTGASSEQVQTISFLPFLGSGFLLRSTHQKQTAPSHC